MNIAGGRSASKPSSVMKVVATREDIEIVARIVVTARVSVPSSKRPSVKSFEGVLTAVTLVKIAHAAPLPSSSIYRSRLILCRHNAKSVQDKDVPTVIVNSSI